MNVQARDQARDIGHVSTQDLQPLLAALQTLKRGQAIRHLLYLFERDEAVRLIRAG